MKKLSVMMIVVFFVCCFEPTVFASKRSKRPKFKEWYYYFVKLLIAQARKGGGIAWRKEKLFMVVDGNNPWAELSACDAALKWYKDNDLYARLGGAFLGYQTLWLEKGCKERKKDDIDEAFAHVKECRVTTGAIKGESNFDWHRSWASKNSAEDVFVELARQLRELSLKTNLWSLSHEKLTNVALHLYSASYYLDYSSFELLPYGDRAKETYATMLKGGLIRSIIRMAEDIDGICVNPYGVEGHLNEIYPNAVHSALFSWPLNSPPTFKLHPGKWILKSGEALLPMQYLMSQNEKYCLVNTGNHIVLVNKTKWMCSYAGAVLWTHPTWKTRSSSSKSSEVFGFMEDDGNFLVCFGPDPSHNKGLNWSTGKTTLPKKKFFATMQGDGNFCVYSGTPANGQFLWATGTTGL